jgi:predicted Zn-dependent protease
MTEDLFPNLEQMLAPMREEWAAPRSGDLSGNTSNQQSFKAYRLSRPARQTAQRRAIYLSRVGELTAMQEAVVTATADFLARFFDLPLRRGADFDPATFPAYLIRQHPFRGHSQLLSGPFINNVLSRNRPEEALIYLAVTAWDLCSDEHSQDQWGSGFGEAWYGNAAIWSLRYVGDPGKSDRAFRGCLRRSCAVATHEALHVLGLDHCADLPCLMRGSACLSAPLQLCPPCFRKFCWNRQLHLLPYLERIGEFLAAWAFSEDVQRVDRMIRLLAKKPWKRGSRRVSREKEKLQERRGEQAAAADRPRDERPFEL